MSLFTNPTATITIDGLAICYFDKIKMRWVVRFPKEPTHKLKLLINGTAYPVENANEFSIFTIRGIYPDYEDEYEGGCLDTKVKRKSDAPAPAPAYSMRWAINLCDDDDVPPGFRGLQTPPYGNILLEITNAVCYVAEVPETFFYRLKLGVDGNHAPNRVGKEFGRVSGLIAGDIMCEPGGGLVIKKDGAELVKLEAKPRVTHKIHFSNMEPEKADEMDLRAKGEFVPSNTNQGEVNTYYKGDFHVYYDSLKNARERHALWGLEVYERGSRTDCDGVWMDDPELP